MLDLTTSPEFMNALQSALVVAATRAQILPAPSVDPEDDWLTGPEAMAYLRLKETAFKSFRERHKATIVTSHGVGSTEIRYQRASLQRIMRAAAIGLPEPAARPPAPMPTNGRLHQPVGRPGEPARTLF